MTVDELLKMAADLGIDVDRRETRQLRAFSMPGTVAVDFSKFDDDRVLKQTIAHELGHVVTHSFYREGDTDEKKTMCERLADAWSYNVLMPMEQVTQAVEQGYTTLEQIASHFDVTPRYAKLAIQYYQGGTP